MRRSSLLAWLPQFTRKQRGHLIANELGLLIYASRNNVCKKEIINSTRSPWLHRHLSLILRHESRFSPFFPSSDLLSFFLSFLLSFQENPSTFSSSVPTSSRVSATEKEALCSALLCCAAFSCCGFKLCTCVRLHRTRLVSTKQSYS